MSRTPDIRTAAPPPDRLRDLHRRLAAVLADLDFPAQRWQVVAVAEIYGCDTVTRAMIERAPEQRYHTLPELVAVLGSLLGGRPAAPVPTALPPRAVRSGAAPERRVTTRVAHPSARPTAPRSPRPAA